LNSIGAKSSLSMRPISRVPFRLCAYAVKTRWLLPTVNATIVPAAPIAITQ
jgi:hypothetical protein